MKTEKTRLKELHTTINERGYPTTLIDDGLELAERIPQRKLRNPKKHNEKHLAYISTKKNQPWTIHRNNEKSRRN